jgi:hypothetical protein
LFIVVDKFPIDFLVKMPGAQRLRSTKENTRLWEAILLVVVMAGIAAILHKILMELVVACSYCVEI